MPCFLTAACCAAQTSMPCWKQQQPRNADVFSAALTAHTVHISLPREVGNADAHTRNKWARSLRIGLGLHGYELRLWRGDGQAGSDRVVAAGGRSRSDVV